MRILLTTLFLWVFVCQGQVGRPDAKNTRAFKEFYRAITKHFTKIDRLNQSGKFDSLEREGNKIIDILNRYKTYLFNFPDSLDYDLVYLTKSADKKLVLVSWDTRMGGTLIEFTTMAIFKTPQGITTKMLLDTSNKAIPHTYMHYNSINTVTTSAGKNIYLAWGNGQGSTANPWQEVRAFSILNSNIAEVNIFPDKSSSLYVEFDLHAFKKGQRVPVIKLKNGGRIIQVPIEGDKQGFAGKYETYVFNGKTYKVR